MWSSTKVGLSMLSMINQSMNETKMSCKPKMKNCDVKSLYQINLSCLIYRRNGAVHTSKYINASASRIKICSEVVVRFILAFSLVSACK
jgi:hypothetical protein